MFQAIIFVLYVLSFQINEVGIVFFINIISTFLFSRRNIQPMFHISSTFLDNDTKIKLNFATYIKDNNCFVSLCHQNISLFVVLLQIIVSTLQKKNVF